MNEKREYPADAPMEATAHASGALPRALKTVTHKTKNIAAGDEYSTAAAAEQENRPAKPNPDDGEHSDAALLISAAL